MTSSSYYPGGKSGQSPTKQNTLEPKSESTKTGVSSESHSKKNEEEEFNDLSEDVHKKVLDLNRQALSSVAEENTIVMNIFGPTDEPE